MNLHLGEIVPNNINPTNKYILHTTCTHSDDFKSVKKLKFDVSSEPALIKTLHFCEGMINHDMSNAKEVSTFACSLTENLEIACGGNEMLISIIPHDKDYPGMFATLTEFHVNFFNELGIEYNVIISK